MSPETLQLTNAEADLLRSLLPSMSESELAETEFLLTGRSIDAAPELTLYAYTVQAWPYIEQVPFVDNWHIGAICEHLEAVTSGQIENLLMNVPPGTMKSLLVSVIWPSWEWTRNAAIRWGFWSYSQELTVRDSIKCRALIASDWYQSRWPIKMRQDQDQKTYYENIRGGFRMATTVRGRGTGHHPDRIVVDDPHNVKQAESEVERRAVIDWWDLTMPTRGLSRGARRVVIMQRLHEEDLSGHILSKSHGNWTHICLPMRFEPNRMTATPLGWTDPRQEEGELLWPVLFSEEKTAMLESDLGSYGVAGQLQQRPSPKEGGRFKRNWWKRFCHDYDMIVTEHGFRIRRDECQVVVILDPANRKTKTSKYTAIGAFLDLGDQRTAVLEVKREKLELEQIVPAVYSMAQKWDATLVGIEDNGFQRILVNEARNRRLFPKMPEVLELKAIKSKLQRATSAIVRCEQGRIYLASGPSFLDDEDEDWVDAFIDEHAAFTGNEKLDKYTDQVDVMAYGVVTFERYASVGDFEFIAGEAK